MLFNSWIFFFSLFLKITRIIWFSTSQRGEVFSFFELVGDSLLLVGVLVLELHALRQLFVVLIPLVLDPGLGVPLLLVIRALKKYFTLLRQLYLLLVSSFLAVLLPPLAGLNFGG